VSCPPFKTTGINVIPEASTPDDSGDVAVGDSSFDGSAYPEAG